MKFWIKALLCGVTALSLAACDDGEAPVTTSATTTTSGSASAAVTGLGDQGYNVAQFGVGAAVSGVVIPFAPLAPPAQLMERPLGSGPIDVSSRCTGGGSASQLQTGETTYQIVYTNCKVNDSSATFKGTITVAVLNGDANTSTAYNVDFDTAGLVMSGTNGSSTFTFTYKNRAEGTHGMAITGVVRSGTDIKKLNSQLNAVISTGTSSSVTLQDYLIAYDGSGTPEKLALTGKYLVSLKLSDFATLPAGVPDQTINLSFDVSTNPILTVGDKDGFSGGTLIMNDATLSYKISLDFTARKITITVSGQAFTADF